MTIFNDSQLPVAMVIDYNVKGQFLLFCKVSTPDASCDQWHSFSFQKLALKVPATLYTKGEQLWQFTFDTAKGAQPWLFTFNM